MREFNRLFRYFLIAVSVVGFIGGCASSKKKSDDADMDSQTLDDGSGDGLTLNLNGDSDSMTAGALSTVYFPLDSSRITSSAQSELQANAEYLKSNPELQIQIEGHCDERGSIQYNLALGERRAKSVKDYLVALGVEASRMTTVSFGKERPIAFGHDESAWSKNRRANFVVTAK